MKQSFRILFPALILLLAVSCRAPDTLLFIKSQYLQAGFTSASVIDRQGQQALARGNIRFRYFTLLHEDLPGIYPQIARPGVKYLAFDPLLNNALFQVIGMYPEKLFIAFSAHKEIVFPNLLKVGFDKQEALEKGGRITGLLLREKHPVLVEKQAPGEKLKLLLLVSDALAGQASENALFQEAFVREYSADCLLIERVRELNDRNEIAEKIDRAIHNGAVILFPRLHYANAYSLDLAAKKGILLIAENWSFADTEIDKRIILSIDEPLSAALPVIMKTGAVIKNGVAVWEKPEINIGSRLTWGRAFPIPVAVKEILPE